MRVSVFGLGYVGCVTASCVSKSGHQVIGVDIDAEKVAAVNAGTPPVVEPGLGELLAELVAAHRLRATVSAAEAVRQTDVGLICVGTPGRGPGTFAMVKYEGTIPDDKHPTIEATYRPKDASRQPVKELYELKERC